MVLLPGKREFAGGKREIAYAILNLTDKTKLDKGELFNCFGSVSPSLIDGVLIA